MTWPTNPGSRTQSVHYGARKLGELVDFLDNQRKPISDQERQKRIGPYPYYGANGQVGWIDDFIFNEDLVLLAEDGGYFGSKDRPIAYRISGKTWVNNHAHVLKVKRDIAETGFIHYSLMFYDIKPYITGSTRTKLNKSAAERIKIILPPLAAQKQIVGRLDKIAEAQKLNDDLIQKTDELFQSLLHQELNPAGKDWEVKKLEEVLDYEQPIKYIVGSTDYKDEYSIPVLTAGKSFILGYTNESGGIFPKEKLPVIIFDDFTTASKFVDFPFKVKSSAMKILHAKKGRADINFMFYTIQTIKFTASQHKRYWISEYSKIEAPIPPLETQKKIVKKLSSVQNYKQQLLEQKIKLKELFDSALTKSMSNK